MERRSEVYRRNNNGHRNRNKINFHEKAMSELRFKQTLLNGGHQYSAIFFFKLKIIGGRRWFAGPFRAFTAADWASTPIPRLCDGNVAPLKWTLRRRFIDVTPMESSNVAYYTPMPRLWFLTGKYETLPWPTAIRKLSSCAYTNTQYFLGQLL